MVSFEDKFNRLKEQRVIEANNKKLIGNKGKIRFILNLFGEEIYDQGEIDFNHNTVYSNPNNLLESMPMFDMYESGTSVNDNKRFEGDVWKNFNPNFIQGHTNIVGLYFDGLSMGMHIELQYYSIEEKLEVTWQGRIVLQEISGDLIRFTPAKDWEEAIDKLHLLATKKKKITTKTDKQKNATLQEGRKKKILDHIKDFWGV